MSSVSVVLPSYNESVNILEAIHRISEVLGHRLLEIIVVDDNSPDETWRIASESGNPKVRVIRRLDERGLASALSRGVSEARGEIIAWMDCDLGIPPEILPKFADKIATYDAVIGSRYISGGGDPRPFLRRFLSRILNLYASLLFGNKITDYTSGVAAVRRSVLENVLWKDKGFGEYFAEFSWRCIKHNLRVAEIGLAYTFRKGGVSKSDGSIFLLLKYGIQYGLKMIKWRLTI